MMRIHTLPSRRRVLAGAAATAATIAAPSIGRAEDAALKIAVVLPQIRLPCSCGQSCHRGALIAPKFLPIMATRSTWFI